MFELLISYSKAFQGGNKVPACLITLQPLEASLQNPSGSPNRLFSALLGPAPPTVSSSSEFGTGHFPCQLRAELRRYAHGSVQGLVCPPWSSLGAGLDNGEHKTQSFSAVSSRLCSPDPLRMTRSVNMTLKPGRI